MLAYIDDTCLLGPNKEEIEQVFVDLKKAGYGVKDKGDLSDFLGINYSTTEDGRTQLKQDKLLRQISSDMNFTERTTTKDKPAVLSIIVGKLNFLCNSRPEITYSVHNTARHFTYSVHNAARHSHDPPRESHMKAVTQIVRYLVGTQEYGTTIQPTGEAMLVEVYEDAEFGGNWNKETARDDPDTAGSCIGFIILYSGVPIHWVSKLTTEMCMSVNESKYVALSEKPTECHSQHDTVAQRMLQLGSDSQTNGTYGPLQALQR